MTRSSRLPTRVAPKREAKTGRIKKTNSAVVSSISSDTEVRRLAKAAAAKKRTTISGVNKHHNNIHNKISTSSSSSKNSNQQEGAVMMSKFCFAAHAPLFAPATTGRISNRLPISFFERPTQQVARDLLGKILVVNGKAAFISETEAYCGADDPAAHAYKKTPRSAIAYGPPAHIYVYFIYGMHHCMNIVCEKEGTAGCVLIRAVHPARQLLLPRTHDDEDEDDFTDNINNNNNKRKNSRSNSMTITGPAKVTKYFGITTHSHNGEQLIQTAKEQKLLRKLQQDDECYVANGVEIPSAAIKVTPRVGIAKAVDKLWRFVVNE